MYEWGSRPVTQQAFALGLGDPLQAPEVLGQPHGERELSRTGLYYSRQSHPGMVNALRGGCARRPCKKGMAGLTGRPKFGPGLYNQDSLIRIYLVSYELRHVGELGWLRVS